jgi:hypothetical protein
MTGDDLQRLRNWADAKVTAGQEPLWTWYQYMKLREALDAIIGGMECAAIRMESSPPAREFPILSQAAQSESGAFIGRTTQLTV